MHDFLCHLVMNYSLSKFGKPNKDCNTLLNLGNCMEGFEKFARKKICTGVKSIIT